MRITFNNRNLGYPLLTPDGGDYNDVTFDIDEPSVAIRDEHILIDIMYRNSSRAISQLIADGKARYFTIVANDATFQRTATPQTAQTIQAIRLPTDQFDGMIQLMPYVTAIQQMDGFAHAEHHPEYAQASPKGFSIQPGMILAVGNTHNVNLAVKTDLKAVVNIQPTTLIHDRSFRIDLDDRYITVYVSQPDFEAINRIRVDKRPSRPASLWPSLYLHLITEGIRGLSDHADNHWAQTFQRELTDIGADPDNQEDLNQNALRYAQNIIAAHQPTSPMALLLDAYDLEDSQEAG